MTALTFTPAKFAILLMTSVAVAFGSTNHTVNFAHGSEFRVSTLRTPEAIGQDNGTLTSNYFLEASYNPTTRFPDRHSIPAEPLPAPSQPIVRRNYPPLAR